MILKPLPVLRLQDPALPHFDFEDDFVDETKIAALLHPSPSFSRQTADFSDLALAADDSDFAGWQVTPPNRFAPAAQQIAEITEIQRLPAAPVYESCEAIVKLPISAPVSTHRWWLACLTGLVITAALIALFLKIPPMPLLVP